VSEWTFQRKLIGGIVLICLLTIATSSACLFASRILIANMARVATGEGQVLSDARSLQLIGVRTIGNVEACLLTGGRTSAPAVQAGDALTLELIDRLRPEITDPEGRGLLEKVRAAQVEHHQAFDHALAGAGASSGSPSLYPEAVITSGARYSQALSDLVARIEASRLGSMAESHAAVGRSETILIVVTVVTILLLLLLSLLLIAALNRGYRLQMTARSAAEAGRTEAQASLSEAEAASHVKDEFLATVSHELRNPLAPILTWTQLLRSGTLNEKKTRRALEVIEHNITSQAQLIDDLVDVSRVVSGKFRLDVRPVDLVPVIKAAADSQAPASEAKHIRLQLVLDDRAGLISGDSERLQQVMWNLISNAIKFTPKGGAVQVVLQRAESHVEVSVSDSGVGITPDFLPHVFEAFQQAVGGSTRRHGGLGLGLSIVRHIVELHGGEVTAYSAGPGLGSKFTIKFPLLATARGAEPPPRHPIAGNGVADVPLARLDGIHVLIVEDEPTAREALLELFDSCGSIARAVASAAEAIAVLDEWRPDVLVSDIAMPEEDGYSLIRRIRLRSPERGGMVPAVALTAYAKIGDRVSILAAGFQMYLSKPTDPKELVAVVGSLARRKEPIETVHS